MTLSIGASAGRALPGDGYTPNARAQLSLGSGPGSAEMAAAGPQRRAAFAADEDAHSAGKDILATATSLHAEQDDPTVISIAATADAVGSATYAAVSLHLTVVDRGMITLAFGELSLAAHSTAAAGELVYAATQCTLDIAGADLVVSATRQATGEGTSGHTAWASSISTTRFLALDIVGCGLLGGSLLLDSTLLQTLTTAPTGLSGNVAAFDVQTQVFSGDSITEVNADAIAIEDAFSSAAASLYVATDLAPPGAVERFLFGSIFSDKLTLGAGDDWVVAGWGNDTVNAGNGHNTLFGNAGNDRLVAGGGNDWAFGGIGNDTLQLGEGDNLAYGGAGHDLIVCGAGDDAIKAGRGNDTVRAGDGDNSVLMGAPAGDGNDNFSAGSGADWYFLYGPFGNDVIAGFNLAQGDRLVAAEGDWASEAGLAELNGSIVTLVRPAANPRDLIVTMTLEGLRSRLTLDDFFVFHPDRAGLPVRTALGDAEAVPLLMALFVDGDEAPEATTRMAAFTAGDLLSPLG